ncbi:MAG: DUF4255 domain-containing protein [Dehalococcoidia bacterium]|nr:DUF4255 domain-containing protein [Chloroflexi bacterium CFX7]MCK6565176.1 Pvc16 family protein [Dehalococcoidia bacterium]MCL4231797.1 DUF4255 domain-containing protein [Dehalococcoidia bacterium]NUQ56732.1 DUF4255 domain-containing protein [Dehalococcoidia bacterium]RIL03320.1 MAG: hypothetical protein DCC78_04630 [bacterium]
MFNDVDETLRQVLLADVPIDRTEVEITFDRPTREWSSRLARPTLNLFLFDVRERLDFRDDTWTVTRNANGQAQRERPPRRIDLSYMVTAWTNEAADEHRILARVLACTYRQGRVDAAYLQGSLANATVPILLRAMPPDHLAKPTDFWGVMDNELHASLTWVATVPLDVFAPVTGPLVVTRELQVGDRLGPDRETFIEVAGVAHQKGDRAAGIGNATVTVLDTSHRATTDSQGRFTFSPIPPGEYTWRVEPPGGRPVERRIKVPSENYDIEVEA